MSANAGQCVLPKLSNSRRKHIKPHNAWHQTFATRCAFNARGVLPRKCDRRTCVIRPRHALRLQRHHPPRADQELRWEVSRLSTRRACDAFGLTITAHVGSRIERRQPAFRRRHRPMSRYRCSAPTRADGRLPPSCAMLARSRSIVASPRRPSRTMRIFSSAEYCLRVARRMSRTSRSEGVSGVLNLGLMLHSSGGDDELEILRSSSR
jgi:hypothetical protein